MYTKSEFLTAYCWAFGVTIKKATAAYKRATAAYKRAIVESYKYHTQQLFYFD